VLCLLGEMRDVCRDVSDGNGWNGDEDGECAILRRADVWLESGDKVCFFALGYWNLGRVLRPQVESYVLPSLAGFRVEPAV
jgi:hypothetical protein